MYRRSCNAAEATNLRVAWQREVETTVESFPSESLFKQRLGRCSFLSPVGQGA